MSKYRKWLFDEIELWQNQEIISREQAKQLMGLYPKQRETHWGKLIFAGVGAVIFGLGIILVFAYNWADMHRFSKLSLVILSVIAAHATGYYYSREKSAHKKIGESLHLLGTMMFGSGIWLIAQVYHIDEHYPNALFYWAIGALLVAWFLPSLSHLLLTLVLVLLWHGFELYAFSSPNIAAVWLVIFAILPLVWVLRTKAGLFLTSCLIIFSYSTSYGVLADNNAATLTVVILTLSATMVVCSLIAGKTAFYESMQIIRTVGVTVFAVLLFIFSFSEFDKVQFTTPLSNISATVWWYFFLPTALLTIALVTAFTLYSKKLTDITDRTEIAIVTATSLVATLSAFPYLKLHIITWAIYNLLFLGYSLVLIFRGTHYLQWQPVFLGGIMLSAYTFARFMDLFDSLLFRGIAFLVAGSLLFAIGIYYSRQKQRADQKDQESVVNVK